MRRKMPPGRDIIGVITRRALLRKAGTAFLIYASTKAGLNHIRPDPALFEESRNVMGSASRIVVSGKSEKKLTSIVDEAFKEMKRLEELMTIYDPKSEISQLNINGNGHLSPDCVEVLKRAITFSRLTGVAFDITTHAPNSDTSNSGARADYTALEMGTGNARFKVTGMAVDLGGIAIGYAVDRAIDVLRKGGVQSALVDGGGEVKALRGKTDNLSWRVGIRDPFRKSEFIDIISLDDMAVSTSGNYEKKHIVNPKTGAYSDNLLSATVISKDALTSDALSTAVFVLGQEDGLRLIDKTPNTEGLLVTKSGAILRSRRYKKYTVSL
jgi:thiamine biosynthesis lipoprotein